MRNRTLLNGFIFISTIFIVNSSFAETVSLEYNGFYDRLKQVNKQNYPLVELAFSVPITPDCTIVSGSITTEKEQFPLTYTKQQRLFIPYDPQLKSEQSFTQTELLALTNDMNKLLDGLQGFPMKYFRKPINGLTFEFAEIQADGKTIKVVIDDVESMANEKFTLTLEQITQLKNISFTHKPSVVSPFVSQ